MPKSALTYLRSLLMLLPLSLWSIAATAQTDTTAIDPGIIDTGHDVTTKIESIDPYLTVVSDTLVMIDGETVRLIPSVPIGRLEHSPQTATMYAAILPGLGQIYNRKYWKLPILYGGAAALIYAIHFNNKYYKKYSSAYRDFLIGDPNNKSYMYFVNRAHLTEEQVQGTYKQWFQKSLKNKKDYYRRYRDLSIFGMIGLYAVQVVDACVDAHFFNFDVSDDLAFQWQPELDPQNRQVGARLALRF